MKLSTTFRGEDLLFEGDLQLLLRAIPAGAKITRAQVTLVPTISSIAAPDQQFHETLAVSNGQGDFGLSVQTTPPGTAIIDLSARRTVEQIAVTGATANQLNAQVDMGGIWMPINSSGMPISPNIVGGNTALTVESGAVSLPGLTTQRLKLEQTGNPPGAAPLDVQSVGLLSYPSNLVLRLGALAPVWFKVGDLRAPLTTPDFAPILQAFLDRGQPADGIYEVPFILHSDTLTRLLLLLDIEYYLQQSLLAPQLSQVALPFGYDALPSAQPAALKAALPLNAHVLPRATSARVFGRFDASRVIYGAIGATVVKETVQIAPEQSVANAVILDLTQMASAIDLHVESVTPSATLLVTLQEDVGGKPFGASLLPEPIEVKIERPAAGGTTWASAPLPDDFTFQANRIYWLIVNIAEGKVEWGLEPAGLRPALQTTQDNGLSWRTYRSDQLGGPVVGLYRLRAQPAQYRQPLQIDVAGHRISLSAYDALGKVDFAIDLPALADAVNAALDDAAAQQERTSERIANGAFSAWTRIDRRSGRLDSQPLPTPDLAAPPLVIAPDASRVYYLGAVQQMESENTISIPQIGIIANDPQPRLISQVVLNEDQLDAQPQSITISPDGERLYVAAFGAAEDHSSRVLIWKVDARRGEAQEFVLLAGRTFDQPVHLAADPRCQYVYMASMHSDMINSPITDLPALTRLNADSLEVRGEDEELPRPGTPAPGAPASQPIDKLALTADFSFHQERFNPPRSLLIAPDGRRAYVARQDGIEVVDLDSWVWLGRAWSDDSNQMLLGMALSCDGTRLYALAATSAYYDRAAQQTLLVLDTARLDQAAVKTPKLAPTLTFEQTILHQMPISLGSSGRDAMRVNQKGLRFVFMAATPDDTRLLLADYLSGQLQVIDTATFAVLEPIATLAPPILVAVTPESRRAFVITYVPPAVVGEPVVAGGSVVAVPNAALETHSLLPAMASAGAVAASRQVAIRAVELDGWTADHWALTGGRVAPVCVPGAAKRSARLGSPLETSGLAQIFSVAGGQEYMLRFRALASAPGAQAELFWLNQECGLLDQVAIDIAATSCDAGGALPYTTLTPYAIRLRAPQGADRAELRFRQPFDGYMLLDDVSIGAPTVATDNGDFTVKIPATDAATSKPIVDPTTNQPMLVPQGWQVGPEDTPVNKLLFPRLEGTTELPGIRLMPATAVPATLSQSLTITSGQPFLLEFQAWPFGPQSSPDAPTIELRWLGSAAPLVVPITRQRFDITAIGGTAPADATGVELAFIQPPGGVLDIIQVRLSQPTLVEVPITFLSEAPGELTVSAPVVAYDVDGEPRTGTAGALPGAPAATPAPIGCKPTPPDDQPQPPGEAPTPDQSPSTDEPIQGFCPCCETIHSLENPEEIVSEGGMAAIGGICPNCHVHVTIFSLRS